MIAALLGVLNPNAWGVLIEGQHLQPIAQHQIVMSYIQANPNAENLLWVNYEGNFDDTCTFNFNDSNQ